MKATAENFARRLRGRQVGVIGFGITGQAVTEALLRLGALPLVTDTRPLEQVRELAARIEALGAEPHSGMEVLLDAPDLNLVVVSPGVALAEETESRFRRAGVRLIAEIELAYLLARGPIVAITGTNGKSTTTRMVGDILRNAGVPARVGGNIGEPLVGEALAARPGEYLVAEVSSFQLERVHDFRPRAAALLNIRGDHLDRHGGLEGYVAAKARLFAAQEPEDLAVGNYDDPSARRVVAQARARQAFFSLRERPERGAWLEGERLLLALEGEPVEICTRTEISVRGNHNLANALAACLLAADCGADAGAMRRALTKFVLADHTLEDLGTRGGRRWVNDSKGTNPAATAAALEAVGYPAVLIAGGSDKGLDFEELLDPLRNWARAVVLMGATSERLERVARMAGIAQIRHAKDLREAVRLAVEVSEEGDTVLFSPASASFDMFRDYKDRGEQFRQAVKEGVQ